MNGAGWLVLLQGSTRALVLVRTVILARLLAPTDFGLFAVVLVITTMFDMLTETGLKSALVQRRRISRAHLNSAWSVNILRGFGLAVLLYVTAPLMARFFEHPELELLLRAVSVTILIQGPTNIGVIQFQRDLEFRKECILGVVPVAFDLSTAIIAALLFQTVWALVFGFFVRIALTTLLSYVVSPYRPSFELPSTELSQLLNFGKWVFLYSLVVYLILNADKIFIGKTLGAEELGFYQMALTLGTLVGMEIGTILRRLAFPVYARTAKEKAKTCSIMLTLFEPTALLLFPITLWMVVYAEPLVLYIFGDRWIPMTLLLQLVAVKGLIWGLSAVTGGPLFLGIGRPDINFRINLIQLVVLAGSIYPLAQLWGTAGVALATVVAFFISYVLNIVRSLEITGLKFGTYLSVLTVPVIGCSISIMPVVLFRARGLEQGMLGVFASMLLMTSTYVFWLVKREKIVVFTEVFDVFRRRSDLRVS